MITENDFVHPEDAAALRNMEAIPGFGMAVKTLMKYYNERLFHGVYLASTVRLSNMQLPEIYNKIVPICRKLDIDVPEFYLEMDPNPNAFTMGDTKPMVVVTSGLLDSMDDGEVSAVLAHECGHIVCHHVLYHTLAQMLMSGAIGLIGDILKPVAYALLYWSRKSELSADRAGVIASGGGPKEMIESMLRLAGGPKRITEKISIQEFIRQADEYEELQNNSSWDKFLQLTKIIDLDHPFVAVRVREMVKWSESEQYKELMQRINAEESGNICPDCGKTLEPDWTFCKYCGHKLKQ
jgi:Zn-dependent protease with chaperone function